MEMESGESQDECDALDTPGPGSQELSNNEILPEAVHKELLCDIIFTV